MKLEKRSWALLERWQTFKFSLSSTDFTKRRDGAGWSTFGGRFPFYCFVLTDTSLPAERRFDPSAVWSDHVIHIQIHLLSIYTVHLIMRASQEDALCKADWSHTCQNSVLPTCSEVEISHFYFSMTKRIYSLPACITLPDLYKNGPKMQNCNRNGDVSRNVIWFLS